MTLSVTAGIPSGRGAGCLGEMSPKTLGPCSARLHNTAQLRKHCNSKPAGCSRRPCARGSVCMTGGGAAPARPRSGARPYRRAGRSQAAAALRPRSHSPARPPARVTAMRGRVSRCWVASNACAGEQRRVHRGAELRMPAQRSRRHDQGGCALLRRCAEHGSMRDASACPSRDALTVPGSWVMLWRPCGWALGRHGNL